MARSEVNGEHATPLFKYLKKNSLLFDVRKVSARPIP